ncbi:MAG: LEPR-XLL domain-containing protein, partial [Gammaproteobacteria bacterium]
MNKKAKNNHTNPVFEELEARLLLSADPLGVIAEPSLAALQNTVHVASEYTMMVQNHAEQSPAVVLNNSQSSNRAELVIIDSRA